MTIWQAIILGIVEGATEFLPVSSTAHLIIAQKLLGLPHVSVFFTTVVQLGALLALVFVERTQLIHIIREMFRNVRGSTGLALGLATVPVSLVGVAISSKIDQIQNSPMVIVVMSILVGFLLLYAQYRAPAYERPVTFRDWMIMGVFQVVSLLPGTSRSGIVASGGVLSGLTLSSALEASFLLSIPALGLAGVYQIAQLVFEPTESAILVPTLVGVIAAALSAAIVIDILRKTVKRLGFVPFVVYRMIFAVAIYLFFF